MGAHPPMWCSEQLRVKPQKLDLDMSLGIAEVKMVTITMHDDSRGMISFAHFGTKVHSFCKNSKLYNLGPKADFDTV